MEIYLFITNTTFFSPFLYSLKCTYIIEIDLYPECISSLNQKHYTPDILIFSKPKSSFEKNTHIYSRQRLQQDSDTVGLCAWKLTFWLVRKGGKKKRKKNQRVERTEEEKRKAWWKCLHGSNNGLVKSIVSPAHRLILFVCIMYTVCTMTKRSRGLFRFDDVIFFTLFSFSSFTHPLLLPFPLKRTNAFAYWLESESRARERERRIKVHANRCNECANKRTRVPATAYNEVRKSTPWSLLEKRDSKTRKNTVGVRVSDGV